MTDKGKNIQTKLPKVLHTKVDLKSYLKSLDGLSREVAKDAVSYEAFSSVLQMKLDSFKSMFGEHKFDKYCDHATIIYRNIMLTRRTFNPDSVIAFFGDWKQMLLSFTASSRAETFCNNLAKFQCVVDQLMIADNRWSQLIILSVLRLYTTAINSNQMEVLFAAHPSDFLGIIIKMVNIPQHEETSIRTNNAFLTDINLKAGLILSFQPYKIVCGDVYVLSDYELWMDLNVRTKVLTFTAISVTEDKTKNVGGWASTVEMKIVSRQDDLFVTSSWCLITKSDSKYRKMEIEFCFSSRIHTAILESKFSKIVDIPRLDRKPAPVDKNSKAVAPSPKANAKLAQEPILFSINEINFDEPEELKATAQPSRIQNLTSDGSAKHEDVGKIINSQPNPVFESDVKASTKCNRITSAERELRKRRYDREPDCGQIKKARTIISKVSELEPFSEKAANVDGASVERPQITRNEARIHGLAEVILVAADDVIRTLGYAPKNYQMASQAPNNNNLQYIPKIVFDKTVFEQSWPIRIFMESLREQPDYGAEIEENVVPVVDDEEHFDCHYGSISNP